MSDKAKMPSKKEINKYVDIVLKVLPVPMFIGNIICLLNVFGAPNALNLITFIVTVLFEGLSLYVSAFVKCFAKDMAAKIKNDSPLKKVWLSKHLHFLILAVGIFIIGGVNSALNYLDGTLISLVLLCKVIKNDLSKKLGDDMKSTIDSLCDPVLKSENIKKLSAILEILLCPYLFFFGLFTLNLPVLLAFLIDFFFFILFALEANKYHKWVYAQLNKHITEFAKKNEQSFGKHILKALEMVAKVEDLAKQLYPVSILKQIE